MKKAPVDPWGRRPYGTNATGQRSSFLGTVNSRMLNNTNSHLVHHQQHNDTGLLLYRRGSLKQQEDLKISITNVPTAGFHPFSPTVPKVPVKAQDGIPHTHHSLASRHPTASRTGPLQESGGKLLDQILPRPPTSKPAASHHDPLPPITTASDNSVESTSGGSNSEETDDDEDDEDDDDDECLSGTGDELDDSINPPSDEPGSQEDKISMLSDITLPSLTAPNHPFEATIIQDHAHLDSQRYSASVHASGLSVRIDNIVRGFEIRGPLNKEILSRAINAVVRKHPLLTVQFHRRKDKLYVQTNPGVSSVTLDAPVFSGEKPLDAVATARRQLFVVPVVEDCDSEDGWEGDDDNVVEHGDNVGSVSLLDCEGLHPVVTKGRDFTMTRDATTSRTTREHVQCFPKQTIAKLPHISPGKVNQEAPLPKSIKLEGKFQTLMRSKLLMKSPHEHYLILSFPLIVCDYWSSALFVQQLADAYAQIEKVSPLGMQRTVPRIGNHLTHRHGPPSHMKISSGFGPTKNAYNGPIGGVSRFPRLSSARPKTGQQKEGNAVDVIHLRFPSKLHFKQIAMRESQHLQLVSKEKLWSYWESVVTTLIRRKIGPPRVKVVPPVRLPNKLGDSKVQPKTARPKTSRLRPATARFLASKEPGEDASGLACCVSLFHFIKVEESLCSAFRCNFPEEHLARVRPSRLLRLMTLASFVLMLGKCCRGWGKLDHMVHRLRGQADGCSGFFNLSKTNVDPDSLKQVFGGPLQNSLKQVFGGPLQNSSLRPRVKTAKPTNKGKLDLGSFLIGIEMSMRDIDPENMEGLFGPLTNDVGLRVNLSSCETFVDLMVAMEKQLQMAVQRAHYPFKAITEEFGLVKGLPIKFTFLSDHDVLQLTNPEAFYFVETAVGVEGQALARLGSTCYLQPLNGRFSDTCYFELIMWELNDGASVGGGFRYHSNVIRSELVEQFGREYCRVLSSVAQDPTCDLQALAMSIQSPFSKHK